jgi:hypothetical protein
MRAADDPNTSRWTSISQLGWSKQRLIYELQHGLPYRTFPPGVTINWHDPNVQRSLDVEASTVTLMLGVFGGGGIGFDRPTVGVEVLLPTDADGAPLSPEDAQPALAPPVDVNNAPASTLEEDPKDPTLRQEIILAILDQNFPNGIPHPRRPAQLTEIVRKGWKAECDRRPGVNYPPPDRKTVMTAVTRWRS